ncbi:hypothetical protein BDW67DRAFT_179339 [Aspergillus spinulosporus]
MAQTRYQVIFVKLVFLASTTSKVNTTNWHKTLLTLLANMPDSSWHKDINFAPYHKQVEWELDKQVKADIVIVYFHPATQEPISLLELGICARVPEKAIVILCKRFGIKMVDNVDRLRKAIVKRLPEDLCIC